MVIGNSLRGGIKLRVDLNVHIIGGDVKEQLLFCLVTEYLVILVYLCKHALNIMKTG